MTRKVITVEEIFEDLKGAYDLLKSSGPNPLLIESDEFWERFEAIGNKYGLLLDGETCPDCEGAGFVAKLLPSGHSESKCEGCNGVGEV